jgi:hypothetical protein
MLLAASVAAVGLTSYSFGTITGHSICPFYNLTGFPCPGCGATRALLALFHGDIISAFTWNSWFLVMAFIFGVLWFKWVYRLSQGKEAYFLNLSSMKLKIFLALTAFWFLFRLTPFGQDHFFVGSAIN